MCSPWKLPEKCWLNNYIKPYLTSVPDFANCIVFPPTNASHLWEHYIRIKRFASTRCKHVSTSVLPEGYECGGLPGSFSIQLGWSQCSALPGRMFTPTTVPGAALGSSPPDLKVLCDLCIWMCSFLPFHRCYQWIQGSSITQHQAGEMAQWLREQAASRGPVFNSQHRHPAVHNKLQGDPMPPSGLWEHCTHICIYPHR